MAEGPGPYNAIAWWLLVASLPYFLWRGRELHSRSWADFALCLRLAFPVLLAGSLATGLFLPNINYGGGGPSSETIAATFLPCALPGFGLSAPICLYLLQPSIGRLRLAPMMLALFIWIIVVWLPMLGAALFCDQAWVERLVI